LAAIIRQTASKGVVRISMAAGSDARYFAVLLRAWPRGMSKTQCPV
jgi:hypothetical protein